MNENSHKWKMQYLYDVSFNKSYFSKINKKIHNKYIPHYGDTKKNDTDQPKIYSSP